MTHAIDVPGRNAAAVALLHPLMRERVTAWLVDCNARGSHVLITDGYRSPAEQASLWAKGRTKPGEPCMHHGMRRAIGTCGAHPFGAAVTWTTKSWHLCGRAVDIAHVASDGRISWPGEPSAWQPIANLASRHGLEWGFAVWGKDMPHFMYRADADGRPLSLDAALVEWRGLRGA